MAKQSILVCDMRASACREPVVSLRMWAEGDRQAVHIDLCQVHAKPILDAFAAGQLGELPTRPRVKMEPTKLRTTHATADLKKKG